MTKETNNTTKETTQPTYYPYSVAEPNKRGQQGRWTRIGAFFSHEDGQGGSLVLDTLPINFDGRIALRTPRPAEGEAAPAAEAQHAQLQANGRRQQPLRGTAQEIDFRPVIKVFNACGAATWLLTELDPDDPDLAFGLCDLGMGFPELGNIRLSELVAVKGPLGLGIEHDRHFKSRKTLSAYAEEAKAVGVKPGRCRSESRPCRSWG